MTAGSGGFDRDVEDFARGARAIVVLPDQGGATRDAEARLEETAGLALAIGVEVLHKLAVRVRAPKPATLIGSGQVEAIAETVRDDELSLAVFDASLSVAMTSRLPLSPIASASTWRSAAVRPRREAVTPSP